jgi:ABC-type multidrug transport system permease subunit
MHMARTFRGLLRHFLFTLGLSLRSPQALVYSYLLPLLFLLAFGSIFRNDMPLLLHQMGQLLTISILGGACFGLPMALVAERERGIWRRYRVLPVSTDGLIASALAARLVVIALVVILQVVLARTIYGTPLPMHPAQAGIAFLFVTGSFLGLGLLITALADDVPAVQALGQCLFLPMILIGGVGVPLTMLPSWVQRAAGFMPGRYAVDVLQRCFSNPNGLRGADFSLIALLMTGGVAAGMGIWRFRWNAGKDTKRSRRILITLALFSWVAVGVAGLLTGRL